MQVSLTSIHLTQRFLCKPLKRCQARDRGRAGRDALALLEIHNRPREKNWLKCGQLAFRFKCLFLKMQRNHLEKPKKPPERRAGPMIQGQKLPQGPG